MRKKSICALIALSTTVAFAQTPKTPRQSVSAALNGKKVTIE